MTESKFIPRPALEATLASIESARKALEISEHTVARVHRHIDRVEAVLRRLHRSESVDQDR